MDNVGETAEEGTSDDEGVNEADESVFGMMIAGSSMWNASSWLASWEVAAAVSTASGFEAWSTSLAGPPLLLGLEVLPAAAAFLRVCSRTVLAIAFRGRQDWDEGPAGETYGMMAARMRIGCESGLVEYWLTDVGDYDGMVVY